MDFHLERERRRKGYKSTVVKYNGGRVIIENLGGSGDDNYIHSRMVRTKGTFGSRRTNGVVRKTLLSRLVHSGNEINVAIKGQENSYLGLVDSGKTQTELRMVRRMGGTRGQCGR